MKKIHTLCVSIILFYAPPSFAESPVLDNEEIEGIGYLLTLSLEELLEQKIDVAGKSVSSIKLDDVHFTGNALRLSNSQSSLSVESVDDEMMEARGLDNVVDAVRSMSGIISGDSPAEPYSFGMRGFTRDSVKLLFDGVSIGRSTLNMRPLGTNNLSRVEVIKGPAVLSGEGTPAGTLNIISKKPNAQLNDHIKSFLISYGDYDSSKQNIELSGPLKQKGAYLVNIDRRVSHGWVDRSDFESMNASASTLWHLNDDVDLTLSLNYSKDDLPGYWGTPLIPASAAQSPEKVVTSSTGLVIDKANRYKNYNVEDYTIDSESLWAKLDIDWEIASNIHNHTKIYSYGADRNWRNAESYIYDTGSGQIERDRLLVEHDRDIWGVNSDFHIDTTIAGKENTFATSFEYRQSKFDRTVGFEPVNFFVDFVDLQNPEPGIFYAASIDLRDDKLDQKTAAVILEDSMKYSSKLTFNAGTRLEYLGFDFDRRNFDGSLNQRLDGSVFQASYNFGASYELFKNSYIYAQYNSQHGEIAPSLRLYNSSDVSNFSPSDIRQYEIGFKTSLWEDKAALTLALYDIKEESKVVNSGVLVNNLQKSKGLELSGRINITDNLKLSGHYAYTDAQYGNFIDTFSNGDFSNKTPINVPDHVAGLWLSYDQLFDLPIEIGGNMEYVSKRYRDGANTSELLDYTLFNAFIAYTKDNYRLALHARNLTDELYVPWSDQTYPDQVLLGAPQTFELSFRIAF
ncbi:MAG: hypothetical protein COB14_04170 [Alphaproteobacteria bacterium]|nr:MAG: hypothetical protein COB14_04170 [Alphaproteobacteria bacterium]